MSAAWVTMADEQLFESVYELIVSSGDKSTAERIRELSNQFQTSFGKTFVAFCGLFSAGKSSLLNTICNSHELATGAVPTTALVSEVVLPNCNGKVVLLDTPGVDSTDDTHRQATEEALHLADIIALVMDYQHVEAEDNLELARSFSEQGKRLVLIVNQVDKHFDYELPFVDFDERVKSVMLDYDINYEAFFYTSTENSPYNQVCQFTSWLNELAEESDNNRLTSYGKRLRELVETHVQNRFETERNEVVQRVQVVCKAVPMNKGEATLWLEEALKARQEIDDELDETVGSLLKEQELLREEFVRFVELAQISPYETTERGRKYAESLRPEFKVGWFRTKQKTADEQFHRLNGFVNDLRSRTEKYLIWPLHNRIRQFIQDSSFADRSWGEEVSRITYEITTREAMSLVKPGALVSSQYPYQYVKDVVAAIKRGVLVQLTSRIDDWFTSALSIAKEAKLKELASARGVTADKIEALNDWLAVSQRETKAVEDLLRGNGAFSSK